MKDWKSHAHVRWECKRRANPKGLALLPNIYPSEMYQYCDASCNGMWGLFKRADPTLLYLGKIPQIFSEEGGETFLVCGYSAVGYIFRTPLFLFSKNIVDPKNGTIC